MSEGMIFIFCVLGMPVLLLALVLAGVYLIIRLNRGPASCVNRGQQAEETRIIQDIHSGLARMERRVETLETLLTDREKGRERP